MNYYLQITAEAEELDEDDTEWDLINKGLATVEPDFDDPDVIAHYSNAPEQLYNPADDEPIDF